MSTRVEEFWTTDPSDLLRVGDGFVLASADTDSSPGFNGGKSLGRTALADGAGILSELQEKFFATGQQHHPIDRITANGFFHIHAR